MNVHFYYVFNIIIWYLSKKKKMYIVYTVRVSWFITIAIHSLKLLLNKAWKHLYVSTRLTFFVKRKWKLSGNKHYYYSYEIW